MALNDFLLNLTTNLAYDLLKAAANRLREAAFGDAQQQALERVYRRAFEAMLVQVAANLDSDTQAHLGDLLHRFVADSNVASRLLDLALVGQELSLAELRCQFEALGFDPVTLPVDLDTAMTALALALTGSLRNEAKEPGSPLYNRVSLELFSALYAEQREHQTLLEQVLDGQTGAKHQLEQHLSSLEGQLSEIRSLLTNIIRASGDRGIAIAGDVTGSVIITGDKNVVLSDGGRLARWWEEIGPDPDVLLPQYLNRVAEVYAPLLFPLGHLSKPILLDDVYLDLPIVKPPTDEALLRPSRPGQQLSGNLIPRADELLKQNERAALVGILGMGKTTTFRYLTWVYAQRPVNRLYWRRHELVPFYARIRDLARLWTQTEMMEGPEGFIDALAGAVSIALSGALSAQNIGRILQYILDQGNALVLLDALDEFQASDQERLDFVTALQNLWSTSPFRENRILLTSRPYRFLNPRGFEQYALQNLEQDVERLVSRLGWAVLQTRHELDSEEQVESWLRQLNKTICAPRLQEFWSPFYVTLMVYLGTGKESAEAGTNLLDNIHRLTDLYNLFIRETIEWEKQKGSDPGADELDLKRILGYTAYYTFVEPLREDWLKQAVEKAVLAPAGKVAPILEFWLNTGLLERDREQGALTFRHSGFQAYGVAFALADLRFSGQMAQVDELNKRYLLAPEWDLIWQLYEGLR